MNRTLIDKALELPKYLNASLDSLPYPDSGIAPIYGKEDGGETDIYRIVISTDDGEELVVPVETKRNTKVIVAFDLASVDYIKDGELVVDCIDIKTYVGKN